MDIAAWPKPRPHLEEKGQTTWPLLLMSGPLLILLLIPLVALVAKTAPASVWQALSQETTRQAIALSVRTSTITVLVVLVFGTPLAYLVGRRRPRRVSLLEALIDLPTVLPPAVAGLALLMAFRAARAAGRGVGASGNPNPFHDPCRRDGTDLRSSIVLHQDRCRGVKWREP